MHDDLDNAISEMQDGFNIYKSIKIMNCINRYNL